MYNSIYEICRREISCWAMPSNLSFKKGKQDKKSHSLSCWLRPKLGHENSIRCFLLLRGKIFAEPCWCQSCNYCLNVGIKYKFQEMFDFSTYKIRFSPNPLFWGRPQYSPPNTVLGRQANLKESSKSKELAEMRLQVLGVVITSDACESKKRNYET